MERELHKRKDENLFPSYDLVVFASDHNTNAHSGYNSYYKDYYMHYDWIRKFSLSFQI